MGNPWLYMVGLGLVLLALIYLIARLVILLTLSIRAHLLSLKGQYGDALKIYDRALRYFPNHAQLLFGRGVALRRLGKDEEAIETYRAAIKSKPKNFRAHYNLAILLRETGQTDEAEKEFLETLELQPLFAKAHINLAIMYDKQGRRDEAMSHYALYFMSGGTDPMVRSRARELGLSDIKSLGQQMDERKPGEEDN